jgi:hypothetical protein
MNANEREVPWVRVRIARKIKALIRVHSRPFAFISGSLSFLPQHSIAFRLELRSRLPLRIFIAIRDLVTDFE